MLSPGTRVGTFEIVAPLGSGGMGEVYRARDARLNRDVAIKVLPEIFTVDPERLARFRREAQVLASLNHTNIGHIYGLEDTAPAGSGLSPVCALVLELVEGPTLAERIAEGPMPLDDVLPIARQIADALECAHEQGVIHRDLKPANIKVRPDGTVKVLDFGLAKALDPASASSENAMNSPTLTARATRMGVIVGTAAYMAPEQARGRVVDRRVDIWAFGVVLFEMLTGKRAFQGDDISITLAAVLKDDVDWAALPADLPPSVRRVLRRCLDKDPKRRLSAIGDARLDLEDQAIAGDAPVSHRGISPPAAPRWKQLLPWTAASAGLLMALIALVAWGPWRAVPSPRAVRLSSEIGLPGTLPPGPGSAAVISPDGETVVFVASVGGKPPQLHVRPLSQLQPVTLAGTEDASVPFFSPDGQSIGFFSGGSLKKIAVTGGGTMTLCPAPGGRGGTWAKDGTIVFQPTAAPAAVLHRVSDGGGTATPLGVQAENESTQRWPQILPDGRGVLYTGNSNTTGWDDATIMVQPLDGSAPKLVLRGGQYGRYVATGHVLYVQQATLFAVPFDLETLTVTGNAMPVIEGVLSFANTGGAHFSVSDSGTLVYVSGRSVGRESPIHLLDAAGKTTLHRTAVADWYYPRFSPDGRKLAVTMGAGAASDIWIYEPERDLTKFTFENGPDFAPVWTPDGTRIAFASVRTPSGVPNLYWQRSNGTGGVERLTESSHRQTPYSFHRSGEYLAFSEAVDRNTDIIILPFERDEESGWKPGTPTAFLSTPFNETAPMFSPDGRWLAYASNESGPMEIYVRPFPTGDSKWKISNSGGIFPAWSRRNELLYLVPGPQSQRLMVVSYDGGGDVFETRGVPREWSPQPILPRLFDRSYDLHPDGLRIAMVKPPDQLGEARDKAVFVFNFFDELRRIAAGK